MMLNDQEGPAHIQQMLNVQLSSSGTQSSQSKYIVQYLACVQCTMEINGDGYIKVVRSY